ncbi:MAG: porphobilinogen synthase [Gammaproteobacteria bacterium]|uniref:Delta-aminolevulinic acid dehydratase n=1 Tax=SAR86 cluster bacterium TaxID=2030880 RepID=A0A520MEF4_9GAMM|nr:MAG: delta-aminolevulinic acid dehydratase [Gammaproteobacteria bacterium TMED242]RZO19606.1 MAG: porphobilinogen synthase [SAR86 cluster bacterium]|tara:strand:+ start:41 stop:1039 length:999 start_codon:yes stop_codon:yes gene_type:complete
MFIDRKFPKSRLRRLRLNSNIIDLVSENDLSSNDLIQPLFIKENLHGTEKIESMPGILRFGEDALLKEIEDIINSGINSVALFPVIDSSKKNNQGTESTNSSNLICKSIRNIKEAFPEIIIISDVALDPYTDHGHDGIIVDDYVDNDATIEILKSQSLVLADAGADIIAPSDMMDGRIGIIREALENADYKNTILLSYAAKYNSKFYGPFRDAVNSANNLGNSSKASYQMSQKNKNEALHEVAMDINEGADIVMVKPGMPYLDIISSIKETFKIPTFAYQVSGEYSMLKLAINKGWLDENVMLESLLSFKRAGADAILTYSAKDISMEIKNK